MDFINILQNHEHPDFENAWSGFFLDVSKVQSLPGKISNDETVALIAAGQRWSGAGWNTSRASKALYNLTMVPLVKAEWRDYLILLGIRLLTKEEERRNAQHKMLVRSCLSLPAVCAFFGVFFAWGVIPYCFCLPAVDGDVPAVKSRCKLSIMKRFQAHNMSNLEISGPTSSTTRPW